MLDRRDFVLALCATGALTACQSGPPKPSSVVLNFAGVKGMNPGPDGSDRPVTVMIYRLRSTGKFNSADYFALEGNAADGVRPDKFRARRIVARRAGGVKPAPPRHHSGAVARARKSSSAATMRASSTTTCRCRSEPSHSPVARESISGRSARRLAQSWSRSELS